MEPMSASEAARLRQECLLEAAVGDRVSDQKPLQIVITERRRDPVIEAVQSNPCAVGLHRWAYLARGGIACARCGKAG